MAAERLVHQKPGAQRIYAFALLYSAALSTIAVREGLCVVNTGPRTVSGDTTPRHKFSELIASPTLLKISKAVFIIDSFSEKCTGKRDRF